MKFKHFILPAIMFAFGLTGCSDLVPSGQNNSDTSTSDLDKWLSSAEKFDYNGDGKVNEVDYEIYKELVAWLESDKALDYTGDRKINYDDYSFYVDFKEWIVSNDSLDLNGDSKINVDDYRAFLEYVEWKKSDDALDLNGDSKINIDDYEIYISSAYQNYLAWQSGNASVDYNDDGKVDDEDYEIYQSYLAWKEGETAADLNDDRVIDYNDYVISLNPSLSPYEKWAMSSNAKDYNNDGKIDELDFYTFSLFGTYRMSNLQVNEEGAELGFGANKIPLKTFPDLLNDFIIQFSETGVEITLNQNAISNLTAEDKQMLTRILSTCTLTPLNANVVSLEFVTTVSSTNVTITFYLSKNTNGNWQTQFQFASVIGEDTFKTTILFELVKTA